MCARCFFAVFFLCQFIPRRGVDRARVCVSVLLLAWCDKGLWCASIDRGVKMEPLYFSFTRRPSIRGRGVWGSEDGRRREGVGWCENGIRLLSDWPKYERCSRDYHGCQRHIVRRLHRLCVVFAERCLWTLRIVVSLSHHWGMWTDEEHLAACVLHVDH